jgi:hypothetical protein
MYPATWGIALWWHSPALALCPTAEVLQMDIFVDTLTNFLGIYLAVLLVRVVLSWVP